MKDFTVAHGINSFSYFIKWKNIYMINSAYAGPISLEKSKNSIRKAHLVSNELMKCIYCSNHAKPGNIICGCFDKANTST